MAEETTSSGTAVAEPPAQVDTPSPARAADQPIPETEVSTPPVAETPPPKDWAKTAKEDKELAQYIDQRIKTEAGRLAKTQREQERQKALRTTAREATAATDPEVRTAKSLQVAESLASEPDEDEERTNGFLQKQQAVQPLLNRIVTGTLKIEYAKLHTREGKAEMDRRYNEDPEAFADWALDEATAIRANAQANKAAPTIAQALADDQVAKALSAMPTPLTGGAGGAGALTEDQYEAMTWQDRRALAEKNPDAINNMTKARAVRLAK